MNNDSWTEYIPIFTDQKPDSQGDTFSRDCVVELQDHSRISRILDTSDGKLSNIMRFKPDICKVFYPCVSGKVLVREGNVITRFKVTNIILAMKNSDPRIPCLFTKCRGSSETE